MFTAQIRTPSQSSSRVLRAGSLANCLTEQELPNPWTLLKFARSPRLGALTRKLREYARTSQVLLLFSKHFPWALKEYKTISQPAWWEMLAHLLNLAETADWFQISWGDFRCGMAVWEEESDDNGNYLANFLEYIPVVSYGFTPESISNYPPMEMMFILLSNSDQVFSAPRLSSVFAQYRLEDEWGPLERQQAWERLQAIENEPEQYPEPLRWLPGLARWACGNSGNPILDAPPLEWDEDDSNETQSPQQRPLRFIWDDAERLRKVWGWARPIVEQLKNLLWWINQDETNLVRLFTFFVEGDYDQLEW